MSTAKYSRKALGSQKPKFCLFSSQHALGFTLLSVTLLLWITSSVAVQAIFGGSAQFRKPVFVTLFNSAMSAFLLLPRIAGDTALGSLSATITSVGALSATAGLIWLCSQFVFNISLLHTSVATNTVLSSTSSIFTFVFSLFICHDPFRWRTFCAALLSCLGCAMVAKEAPQNLQADAVTTSSFGDTLALTSAALFALASVLLRRWAPQEIDMTSYLGVNGLLSIVLAPGVLFVAHVGGLESFKAPTVKTLLALALNAVAGCSFANYLYTRALLLLSPVVANMYMSLSIPCSAVVDELLLGQHRFSLGWAAGASLSCIAVFGAALDLDASDEDLLRKDLCRNVDDSELASLLGNMGDNQEDDGE